MVAGGEREHGQEQAWDASPLGQLGGNPSLHAVPDGMSNPSTQPAQPRQRLVLRSRRQMITQTRIIPG